MDHYAESTWYADIVHFILYLQCLENLDKKAASSLKLKTTKYCLIEKQLFWKDPGVILLRCLDKLEIEEVISESHEGACGGHKYWKATTYKIFERWILLAFFILRCISAGKSMYPLSEVCWKEKVGVFTIKVYCSKCPFLAVGF